MINKDTLLLKSVKVIAVFISLIPVILTILSFMDGIWWNFEYISNFWAQYLIMQIFCLILLLLLKVKRPFIIITVIFTLINLFSLVSLYIPDDKEKASNQIKILMANVNTANRKYDLLASLIKKENPDIVALIEISDLWTENLKELDMNYKSIKETRNDNFGIGLYSKIPFERAEIKYYKPDQGPSIESTINISGKNINIIVTHPLPPRSKEWMISRNEQLLEIGERVKEKKNVILLGDFNLTPRTYIFKKLLKTSGLKDSRKGFGLQLSWPSFQPLFFIPIDHCLLDKSFTVTDRKIGPYIGSDHYPVVINVGW